MEQKLYSQEFISAKSLEVEVDLFWAELSQPDSDFRKDALQIGITNEELEELLKTPRQEAIQIKTEAGFDPVTAAIIIAFAPVAAKVTKDLWDNVFLPWIKAKRGANVLSPK